PGAHPQRPQAKRAIAYRRIDKMDIVHRLTLTFQTLEIGTRGIPAHTLPRSFLQSRYILDRIA
ncbi:MAG: hypothetical protein ACREP5_11265, partial [Candidatus Binatia bacterium]